MSLWNKIFKLICNYPCLHGSSSIKIITIVIAFHIKYIFRFAIQSVGVIILLALFTLALGKAGTAGKSRGGDSAGSFGPTTCGRYPKDTADHFVRNCIFNLNTIQCTYGLHQTLTRCHGQFRWFAKVHFGPEMTRCICDYCAGENIGPFHYDIAGQASPCFRPLPPIPEYLCYKSFCDFWKQMKTYGACFVEKVRQFEPVHAFWQPRSCGKERHCPRMNTFLFAFK